ncbi:hypothetical protein DID88_010308 [Monilinia fructigena]|uniref:C2H2-type domain-containing protein n=1 Tax=Monilinia fructigena TaxID=38457 RepID=A0A395ISA4_9HELO|nr:hypothetical protein DID88_010308 [Monilinia fructigena]
MTGMALSLHQNRKWTGRARRTVAPQAITKGTDGRKETETESNKESKAARPTSNDAPVSESSKENSTHITHSQSPSPSQSLSDDYTISYPCHIRTCPEYQKWLLLSQQALMRHYVNVHGEAYHLCDYSSCQSQIGTATSSGSKIRFLRSDFRASKAEYKAHLRNFHKEDIGLSSKLSSEENRLACDVQI